MSTIPSFFQPIKDPELTKSMQNRIGMAADRYFSWSSRSFVWKKDTARWEKDSSKKPTDFDKALKVIIGVATLGFVPLSALIIKAVYRNSLFERVKKQNVTKTKENDLFNKNAKTDFKAKKGATTSDSIALYKLGMTYKDGPEENLLKAIECFKSAAEKGNVDAMVELGRIYQLKFYEEEDSADLAVQYKNEALKWLNRAVDKGNKKEAYYLLGHVYNLYDDSTEEIKEAIKYYELAAQNGHADAMYELGQLYNYSELEGVENKEEAFAWYQKAANGRNTNGMLALAYMYETGDGVKEDQQKAAKWYLEAAEGGDYDNAMVEIGNRYLVGNGIEKNLEMAEKWLSKALKAGNKIALNNLGVLSLLKQTEKDEIITKFFQKAAKEKTDAALFNLAIVQRAGFGGAEKLRETSKISFDLLDKEKVIKYLTFYEGLAAQNPNNSNIKLFLGVGYLLNNTPNLAKIWLKDSAGFGNRYANDLLKELEENP